jgi:hypothetical protein
MEDYSSYFVTVEDDLDATTEDQVKAVAFRVLASAALEDFVEERCRVTARAGIERIKRGEKSATGRALLVWFISRNIPGCIPIHEADALDHFHQCDAALEAYIASVRSNHGLNATDFYKLVNPVGLRTRHIPTDLPDKLQALAEKRDPVVHVSASKRITRQIGPNQEIKQINDIVNLLQVVDESLTEVVDQYPLARL